MVRIRIAAVLSLCACVVNSPPVDTDPPTTTSTTTTTTTAPPKYDGEGSVVMLIQHPDAMVNSSRVSVAAVFAESRRGYTNLAQCISARETWCAPSLPEVEDDYVPIEIFADPISANLSTANVGDTIALGDYTIPRTEAEGHDIYFANDLFSQGFPSGALDLSFSGGSWGDFTGTAVQSTPGPLVVSSPDPARETGFVAGRPIELRWNGGGNGQVYLAVLTPVERRLYLLADDGEFDLDLAGWQLNGGDAIDLAMGRWTTGTIDQEGNDIQIEVHDEQWLFGTYRDLAGRTEIVAENNCIGALTMAPLTTGQYFGSVSSNANTMDPLAGGCTGWAAPGQDGLLRVELPDQGQIEATLGFVADDASLYLLSTCGIAGSCVIGSDSGVGAGSLETVSYINDSGSDEVLYLVIDSYNTPNVDMFQLDVTITSLQNNLLVDSCADALAMPATPNGVYQGTLAAHTNYLDPACNPAPGAEGLAKFELQTGETLNATATMPGADPALYVLYNCAIGDSCALGENASAGPSESLIYTNNTPASEIIYLAVDSAGVSGDYTLDVLVQ